MSEIVGVLLFAVDGNIRVKMHRNNEVQFRSLSTKNYIICRKKNSVSFHKKKKTTIDKTFIRKDLNFFKNFLPGIMHF